MKVLGWDLNSGARVREHWTYCSSDVMCQEFIFLKKLLLEGNGYESRQVHEDIKLATESPFQISSLK